MSDGLNREQIIKALEWCSDEGYCRKCPMGDTSNCHIEAESLALIKELTEENERLTINMNTYGLTAKRLADEANTIKADTVQQIQLKMAMHYGTYTDKDMTPITEAFRVLDQIAKEMLEG